MGFSVHLNVQLKFYNLPRTKLIGKKVSQAKFMKIWNNTIGVATGAALEKAIAKGLKACGVPKGIANTAATVISTAVSILV